MFDKSPLWKSFNGSGRPIRESLIHDGRDWCTPRNSSGACAFWLPSRLCSLQKQYGPDILPSVCRTYPRIITVFPDRKEFSLDPCCPEVALSARCWKTGDFEIIGDEAELTDSVYLKRKEALGILSDENLGLRPALCRLAEMYGTGLDVPKLELKKEQELFLRKMAALMVFSVLLPHEGHPKTDNVMKFILESLLSYVRSEGPRMPADWDSLSLGFSTFLTDKEIAEGCDDEIEGRYKDVRDCSPQ